MGLAGKCVPAHVCLAFHVPTSPFLPEPTNVELRVDGVSDICTKGGDINFLFTGFSVNGKVWLWAASCLTRCSVSSPLSLIEGRRLCP